MRARRTFLCAVKAFAVVPAIAVWLGQARADDVLTLSHQGIARSATIHQPAGMPNTPAPVVIGLNGRGQTTERFRDWLHLDTTADREHFAVVYPDAIDREWSYGRPIIRAMPTVNGEPADDLGFIRLLIDNLIETKRADPARIYVAGLSRGGLMTFTIACARDRSDPTRIWLINWTDCQGGGSMRLYRVNGGGHQVPSFSPNSEEEAKKFGTRNHDIETADEIWSFVKSFSR
jgi:poly(3-hydroxybutyrate) depolymerase